MEDNVRQHSVFMGGLGELRGYAERGLKRGEEELEYDAGKLRRIIDGFGMELVGHLGDEIETLVGLKEYDGPELLKAYWDWEVKLRGGDKVSPIEY